MKKHGSCPDHLIIFNSNMEERLSKEVDHVPRSAGGMAMLTKACTLFATLSLVLVQPAQAVTEGKLLLQG